MKSDVVGWFLIGPLILLVAASAYASTLQLAALTGRQQNVLAFVDRIGERMESRRRVGTALWGCAIFIALLAATVAFWKAHLAAPFGVITFFALATLVGLACAASAQFIERGISRSDALDLIASAWPANGWRTLFLAAFFPIVGWIGGAALIMSALGAAAELYTAKIARRNRPPDG